MRVLVALAVLFASACGGVAPGSDDDDLKPGDDDGDGNPGLADGSVSTTPDAAPPETKPDAATTTCPPGLPATFGDLGTVTANKNDVSGHYNVFIDLQNDPRWFFAMNLHPGRGVFEGGVVPGVYDIAGDDTDTQFCSLCIDLFADLDGVDGGPSLHMVPQKGLLTIDSVVGDEVSGHIDDLLLSAIKVVYDDQGIACIANEDGTVNDVPECVNTICLSGHCGRQLDLEGCQTSIEHISF